MAPTFVGTFARDLVFSECPRWHDGRLWVSDMWGRTVYAFGSDGTRTVVQRFDDEPGGLGWLPDGRMLVVSMEQRLLLRVEAGRPVLHADLTPFAEWSCNDLIARADGTAYVSQFGFDLWGHTTPMTPTTLIRVTPDGRADVVADDLMSPNGMALTDDDGTLIVAEPGASRLTRFSVAGDGTLSDRSVFAELTPSEGLQYAPPDGICLDADGAVWAAEPIGRRVLRIEPGGRVTDEVHFAEGVPVACVLGGDDRRTLFVCVGATLDHDAPRDDPKSRIDAFEVEVPGAGRP